MEKLLLRVAEAAELASVGRTKAYELIGSGEWPVVRVGAAVRVPLAGLRAWVEAQTQPAHTGPDSASYATVSRQDGAYGDHV